MKYELTYKENTPTVEAKPLSLKWWSFRQNNSGGYWEVDDDVSHWVHIQAYNVDAAISKLEDITVGHSYCECCGERWSTWVNESDGNPEPMCYGKTLEVFESGRWAHLFPESTGKHRLHFVDGRIASYKIVPTEQIK